MSYNVTINVLIMFLLTYTVCRHIHISNHHVSAFNGFATY